MSCDQCGDYNVSAETNARAHANPQNKQTKRNRYKKQKHRCEKELGDRCEMGGFTRLLHSGQPDDLMDEVPTFVAQPLPESVVAHDWYPVLNRPWAFMQWVQQVRCRRRRRCC